MADTDIDTGLVRGAALLVEHRTDGRALAGLPDDARPADEAQAYAVQRHAHTLLTRSGLGRRAGRKIGCTTKVMQAYLNIDHPCAGGVFEATVRNGSGTFRTDRMTKPGVECEIAVRLGASLPGRDGGYDRASVAAGVAAVMPAIELVDERYVDWPSLDSATLIADDFFNAGCVLGPELEDWRGLDLAALEGSLHVNGEEVGRGTGDAVLGHPLNALAWLADTMAAAKMPLEAGEFVLLGSVVKTFHVSAGDRVRVHFDGLGDAELFLDR